MGVTSRTLSDNTAHLHIVVPPRLALALRQYAAIMGMKPNQVVVFALTSYLADADIDMPKEIENARRNAAKLGIGTSGRARARTGRNGAS